MGLNSASDHSSILKDGKIKPGIYKIQNIYAETYLDIHQHSKQMCCRPTQDLEDGCGLWEIKRSGVGYTVEWVGPGKPELFSTPMEGLNDGTALYVAAYPVAWRIEIVNDGSRRGFGFYWGPTGKTWSLYDGRAGNGTEVQVHTEGKYARQVWKLIPVKAEDVFAPSQPLSETPGSASLPSYEKPSA